MACISLSSIEIDEVAVPTTMLGTVVALDKTMEPVPFGVTVILVLVTNPVIVVPLNSKPSTSSFPVTCVISASSLPRKIFPETLKSPVTFVLASSSTVPVPAGIILMFSFVLADTMLNPFMSRFPPS